MSRLRKPLTDLQVNTSLDPYCTPESRGLRVRLLRSMTNLSRDELAAKYSTLNANTLKSWEMGREGGLTEAGAAALSHVALQEGIVCSVEWLMFKMGEGPRILATHSAASEFVSFIPSSISSSKQNKLISEELRLFRSHYPEAIDHQITDDSMAPLFEVGDLVAGIPYMPVDLIPYYGTPCIIILKEGEKCFRCLSPGDRPQQFHLFGFNQESSASQPVFINVEILYAAPIIWHRKRLKG